MGLTHHDGIAVYGSGFYIGRKPTETAIASDVSGTTHGLLRFDAGIRGGSGHIASISTRLSTVGWAIAQEVGALPTASSGRYLTTQWSGNAVDIYRYNVTGSAACSSRVAWGAWGT